MFVEARGSALAVAQEEAITPIWKRSAGSARIGALLGIVAVTAPVRRIACDSCVPFHGDSQIARHSGANRRRRRRGRATCLAVGRDWLGSAGDDVDATNGVGAGAGGQDLASRVTGCRHWVGLPTRGQRTQSRHAVFSGVLAAAEICLVGLLGRGFRTWIEGISALLLLSTLSAAFCALGAWLQRRKKSAS
jgi:hypothetical protein